MYVCLCQIFEHQFNLVTFTRQHGSYRTLPRLIELSYRTKIIFKEQRSSYINIRLTNVKLCSGVSS